jgi:hypothetical protein
MEMYDNSTVYEAASTLWTVLSICPATCLAFVYVDSADILNDACQEQMSCAVTARTS